MPGSAIDCLAVSKNGGDNMGELSIRGAQAQRNLLEWSQRVAE